MFEINSKNILGNLCGNDTKNDRKKLGKEMKKINLNRVVNKMTW